MTTNPPNVAEVIEFTDRELEIQYAQKMVQHRQHQQRVGTITRLGRQELAHARHVVRLAYLSKVSAPLTPAEERTRRRAAIAWLRQLRMSDFRAYQALMAASPVDDPAVYLWWFRLGDEQRYSLIRQSMGAIRDDAEQFERERMAHRVAAENSDE